MKCSKFLLCAQLLFASALVQACVKNNHAPVLDTHDTTHVPADTMPLPGDTTTIPIDTMTHNNDDTLLSYLALGDSYTIGQSVTADERYPAQTVDMLSHYNLHVKPPQYIATTGWTTLNLLSAISLQNPQGPFDIVTLLIGVNDQYQHFDTGGYRIHFTQLLEKSIALAGNNKTHVFVLSIPDYGVTPFGGGSPTISAEIDEFNNINKQVTLSYNIAYINVTDLSKDMGNDPSLIADGLHPSGKEYFYWAVHLSDAIKAAKF